MQRDLAAILFYEDGVFQSPYSHTANDTVGVALNSDELFLGNVRSAAATLFTLARPIAPAPIDLRLRREPGDPLNTVRLEWTGGFPGWDLHRLEAAEPLRDDAWVIEPDLRVQEHVDAAADGALLFYSVEENP